ncbi:MAG: hypothetical protein TECD_00415 [Hyphomicrobiaceae bacterium hypho_1]
MRYETKPFQSSIWTKHLALFTAFIVLLTIIFHRIFGMDTRVALNLFTLSFVMSGLILILGSFALSRIWQYGWKGGRNTFIGMLISISILIWPLWVLIISSKHPAINDITTDLANPPKFVILNRTRSPSANSITYNGKVFASQQRDAYKNIKSLKFDRSAIEILELVRLTLLKMQMTVAGVIPINGQETGYGQVEATDRTPIIGFYDDVVVRVAKIQNGTIVDIRSSSRYGKSDFGRNANRIRKFQEELIARILVTIPKA